MYKREIKDARIRFCHFGVGHSMTMKNLHCIALLGAWGVESKVQGVGRQLTISLSFMVAWGGKDDDRKQRVQPSI